MAGRLVRALCGSGSLLSLRPCRSGANCRRHGQVPYQPRHRSRLAGLATASPLAGMTNGGAVGSVHCPCNITDCHPGLEPGAMGRLGTGRGRDGRALGQNVTLGHAAQRCDLPAGRSLGEGLRPISRRAQDAVVQRGGCGPASSRSAVRARPNHAFGTSLSRARTRSLRYREARVRDDSPRETADVAAPQAVTPAKGVSPRAGPATSSHRARRWTVGPSPRLRRGKGPTSHPWARAKPFHGPRLKATAVRLNFEVLVGRHWMNLCIASFDLIGRCRRTKAFGRCAPPPSRRCAPTSPSRGEV